jgi:hypothetical protein
VAFLIKGEQLLTRVVFDAFPKLDGTSMIAIAKLWEAGLRWRQVWAANVTPSTK